MDFKTLKNVIDDTFSLKEEKVLFDNNFLENSAGSYIAYTTSILFKLIKLLPMEANKQDKNHWKGELVSPLQKMLSSLGGVKNPKLILDKFNEKLPEAYLVIKQDLEEKYSSLMPPKELTTEMVKEISDKYYPIIAKWLFDNFKIVQKDKKGNAVIATIKARELVNSWFE